MNKTKLKKYIYISVTAQASDNKNVFNNHKNEFPKFKPPTKWITVLQCALVNQSTILFQLLCY